MGEMMPSGLPVTALEDLTKLEAWNEDMTAIKYLTFYIVTNDEEVYFGETNKAQKDMTLPEYAAALKRVKDAEIYPEIPKNFQLTIAPKNLNDSSAFVKRPGLAAYEVVKGTNYIPKALLDETLIMEQISKSAHPNIITYYGCRLRRGRITAILFERLGQTLSQYVSSPDFQQLDKVKFVNALELAVTYLHSLGLAHNDINPDNIMLKDGMPVLIDFGSCAVVGERLQSLGTEGWYEELFFTSEKKHDVYSLNKLREWLKDPKVRVPVRDNVFDDVGDSEEGGKLDVGES
jgi:serine/threonine protein kinase